MKLFKYIFALFMVSALFVSCSNDDDNEPNPNSETEGLILARSFNDGDFILNLYTESGKFRDGYNEVFILIKDLNGNNQNSIVNWNPLMDMGNMVHGCPYSIVKKIDGKPTLNGGYIVFTMPGEWELHMNYEVNGISYQTMIDLTVDGPAQGVKDKRVVSFEGNDGEHYVMALIEPLDNAEVKINDMTVGVFKMESMIDFSTVNGYKVLLDPRMPSMGNHGSPNNEDLIQGSDGLYHGKLSLTMTGWWKLNMILQNSNGDTIKGEPVTDTHTESSLSFDIEF